MPMSAFHPEQTLTAEVCQSLAGKDCRAADRGTDRGIIRF
jgi:hypothetical protein